MPTEFNLIDFFARIWQDTEGVVRLATRDKDMVFSNQLYRWPDEGALAVRYIQHAVSQEKEVYYSPDLYKPEAITDRKATKDYVLGSHVICLDFDGNAPQDDKWYAENDIPLPTIRIQSSTPDRQHAYWVLDQFITDIPMLEALRKQLTYQSKADSSGWDAGQLLRPPYTVNFGYGKKDRHKSYDVITEEVSSRVYGLGSFPKVRDYRPLVANAIDQDSLPSVGKVLAEGIFVQGFVEAFFRTVEDITVGKRSDTLMAIGYYAAESGLTDAEVFSLVQDADSRWGKYLHRTDRTKRIVDIVERARNKYPLGGTTISIRDAEAPTSISPRLRFQFGEVMDDDEVIDWFFDGLLSTKGYGIITGAPGIGKTQLAIRLAEAVCLGKDFLSWKNVSGKTGNVMFMSLEMAMAQFKYFLTQMHDLEDHRDELQERFCIFPLGETIPLDKPEGQKMFNGWVEQVRPDMIIIDSLSKAAHGSLSDDETVRKLNSYFNVLTKTYNCAIVVVHHSKKSQERNKTQGDLDDLYGSRFIGSEADFVVSFVPGYGDQIRVIGSKVRLGPPVKRYALERTPNLNFVIVEDTDEPTKIGFYGEAFHADSQRGTSSGDSQTSDF